ncbi:GDSL-type esterase/lipase family protein [Solirubrobacter phytolaccae]|uniref:GDSL-type esterase/lipase family protein n=1 Tax=Solirubrobacter phytolaccae TaxID=1404360 RepID=A0A9X3NCR6_9ACTN|nr:GDSL-type esterase/lipase family protein [Solirubrobacter phytolaccae]MDA0183719.1 GDSL-type esterase/lipase family protein [Solirubrobacter phytolaccae]
MRWIPLAAVSIALAAPGVASADTVVAMGDSAISGEAGRWAGNTNQAASKTDALGASAYNDAGGAEATPGCHRSKAAEVHIGDGLRSVNLACSGARTYSRTSDGKWKPGIDFAVSGANKGQARMLQDLATTDQNIKAVVVLIGANDYGFADILETCVTNWITSPSWWKNYCHDDASMTAMFSAANINAITANVRAAFTRIKQAMANAGYSESRYEILAQTYSAPLPLSGGMRYPESGWSRQSVGGCGAWNADINWARNTVVETLNTSVKNAVAGMSNVQLLDAVGALYGRRLCENTVGVLEEKGIATWQSPGAVDKTEWVHQIRTVSTIFGPYQLQEDGHPNYWGQLALRNCFRQAYNGGAPRGGSCARGNGLNAKGEPNMSLQ